MPEDKEKVESRPIDALAAGRSFKTTEEQLRLQLNEYEQRYGPLVLPETRREP